MNNGIRHLQSPGGRADDGGMTWQVIAPPLAGMPGAPHPCPEVHPSP